MKAYLVELRYSPLRWWFPILTAADIITLFGRGQAWVGEWPQTSVASQISAFYFAPILAAVAAWSSGRVSRTNTASLFYSAARPAWRMELAQLSATATFGLTAYGLGIATATLVTWLSNPDAGFLWPGYVILGAALLIGFAAAGHLVGRWWKAPFAAPAVSGLCGFLAIAWFGQPRQLGLFVLDGSPFYGISWRAVIVRMAIAICLTGAAVTLKQPRIRRVTTVWTTPHIKATQVCMSLVLLVSLAGLRLAGPVQTVRSIPSKPICTNAKPRICFWPEDSKYLPAAESMAVRITRLASFGFTVPDSFYERGLRGPDHGTDDFYVLDGSLWDASITLAGQVTTSAIPKDCPLGKRQVHFSNSSLQEIGELNMWVTMYIFNGGQPADMHGGPPGVDLNGVARILSWPQQQQYSWVQQHLVNERLIYCA